MTEQGGALAGLRRAIDGRVESLLSTANLRRAILAEADLIASAKALDAELAAVEALVTAVGAMLSQTRTETETLGTGSNCFDWPCGYDEVERAFDALRDAKP